MKTRQLFIFFLAIISLNLWSQKTPTEEAQPIVAEGKMLYYSEMASWYGTDLFLEKYKSQENIGGYFSYKEGDKAICVFFSKGDNPKVIGTVTFGMDYNVNEATVDLTARPFTKAEMDLYTIRTIALQEVYTDTLFKTYKNTNLNLIPLIDGKTKRVYILTGPKQSGVVIFGNDYLLEFNENNKLILKKQLHKNIIPIYTNSKEEEGKQAEGAIHSHLPETGNFITATDICTLMLYEKLAKWKTHTVVSEKYMNLWNCETNELTVLPMDTFKNISEDQKKRSSGK